MPRTEPEWSPDDRADELRRQRTPSVEDAAAKRVVDRDDLPALATLAADRARAGPDAA
jgi:hypothetical protein